MMLQIYVKKLSSLIRINQEFLMAQRNLQNDTLNSVFSAPITEAKTK